MTAHSPSSAALESRSDFASFRIKMVGAQRLSPCPSSRRRGRFPSENLGYRSCRRRCWLALYLRDASSLRADGTRDKAPGADPRGGSRFSIPKAVGAGGRCDLRADDAQTAPLHWHQGSLKLVSFPSRPDVMTRTDTAAARQKKRQENDCSGGKPNPRGGSRFSVPKAVGAGGRGT